VATQTRLEANRRIALTHEKDPSAEKDFNLLPAGRREEHPANGPPAWHGLKEKTDHSLSSRFQERIVLYMFERTSPRWPARSGILAGMPGMAVASAKLGPEDAR
jgi:hypothetical protein